MFDAQFQEKLTQGKVQTRDYRRFACKLPISVEYDAILNNPQIHMLLERLLGEDYVLFNFNSHTSLPGSSRQMMHQSLDPLNSSTFVRREANVAFLHIPLVDMSEEHGVTEVWPVTLYTAATQLTKMEWVPDNAKVEPVGQPGGRLHQGR